MARNRRFGSWQRELAGLFMMVAAAGWAGGTEEGVAGLKLPFEPLIIDGKAWTFHTAGPAKEERKIMPHPRLLITREGLPALKEKFLDPVYQDDLAKLQKEAENGDACANALLYQVGIGNREAYGKRAKELLLAGKFPVWKALWKPETLTATLAYDWTAELLTLQEKTQVFAQLRPMMTRPEKEHTWYENDSYHGAAPYRMLIPLAWHKDGVDDAWCQEMMDLAYDGEDLLLRSPYGPKKGQGYLDVLNSMALDTGGSQAGNHGDTPISGYTELYFTGPTLILPAWQTATGEKVLKQCNFLRKAPYWLAYESDPWSFEAGDGRKFRYAPSAMGQRVMEYMTGLYKEIDPDMAGLAAWHLKTYGRDTRHLLIPRMIMGDLRVKPKSPEDLKMPTAAYLRGADVFISKTGWGPEDTHVRFQVRYLDTNRYEEHTNAFSITRFGYAAHGSRKGKGTRNPGNHSSIWFYEKEGETVMPASQQGTMYWSGLQYGKRRPQGALEVATDPDYRSGGLVAVGVHEGYRFACGDATRIMTSPGAKQYVRTLAHLLPLGQDREFVIIHDRTEIAPGLNRVWNLRTLVEPTSDGRSNVPEKGRTVFEGTREFALVNELGNCHSAMVMTMALPEKFSAEWRGGVGFETLTPEGLDFMEGHARGEWVKGYAADELPLYHHGLGNLFIRAEGDAARQNYLAVMQLGDSRTFDPSKNKAAVVRLEAPGSDAVQVDQWVAVFSSGPGRREKASYTLAADGARRHVVFDLAPGKYVVKKGVAVIAEAIEVKEKDFSLSFQAAGGNGDAFVVQRQ